MSGNVAIHCRERRGICELAAGNLHAVAGGRREPDYRDRALRACGFITA